MDLLNSTPLTAQLEVGDPPFMARRVAQVVAKATFKVADDGGVSLELDDPAPVLRQDDETEAGRVPRDDLIRLDDAFDVVVVGHVYAPHGQPLRQLVARLAVGGVERRLLVTGDRVWDETHGAPRMSQPEAFEAMPMVWARAFGGTAYVEVDTESFVPVAHPLNAGGRGFDARPGAADLGRMLGARAPYPRIHGTWRLPNFEDPDHPIRVPEDDPVPHCWSAQSMQSALNVVEAYADTSSPPTDDDVVTEPRLLARAHPTWVLPRPKGPIPVEAKHLTPSGWMQCAVPDLAPVIDIVQGDAVAELPLLLQRMVLQLDAGRIVLIYGNRFTYGFEPEVGRSVRVRLTAAEPHNQARG